MPLSCAKAQERSPLVSCAASYRLASSCCSTPSLKCIPTARAPCFPRAPLQNIARTRPQDLFAQNRTVQRKPQKCTQAGRRAVGAAVLGCRCAC